MLALGCWLSAFGYPLSALGNSIKKCARFIIHKKSLVIVLFIELLQGFFCAVWGCNYPINQSLLPTTIPHFKFIVLGFAHISAKYLNFAVCFAHLTKNYATKSNLNTKHNDIQCGEGVKEWRSEKSERVKSPPHNIATSPHHNIATSPHQSIKTSPYEISLSLFLVFIHRFCGGARRY